MLIAAVIIVSLIVLRFLYLLLKRVVIISKLKKHSDGLSLLRGKFRSVFICDGRDDLTLKKGDRIIKVAIISTPFRRGRYHFDNNENMTVHYGFRSVYARNYRVPGGWVSFDHEIRVRKYKAVFDTEVKGEHCVIPYPAPKTLSRVSGAKLEVLGNGDVLFGNIKICGLKYFIENVLEKTE